MEHELKSWPEFFAHVIDGSKRFELRRNDREFRVGDTLRLQEYDPKNARYTGLETRARVTYITSVENACALSPVGLDQQHCILSIELIENAK